MHICFRYEAIGLFLLEKKTVVIEIVSIGALTALLPYQLDLIM